MKAILCNSWINGYGVNNLLKVGHCLQNRTHCCGKIWSLFWLVEKDQLCTALYMCFPGEFKTSSLAFNEVAIIVVARVSPFYSRLQMLFNEYKCCSRLNKLRKRPDPKPEKNKTKKKAEKNPSLQLYYYYLTLLITVPLRTIFCSFTELMYFLFLKLIKAQGPVKCQFYFFIIFA